MQYVTGSQSGQKEPLSRIRLAQVQWYVSGRVASYCYTDWLKQFSYKDML